MNAAFWKMAKAMHKAAVLSKDYTQYAAVVSQVLDAYLSNEDIRLEFDPDRNFGWANRRSVLIAGQDKFSLRFPATLIEEQWGSVYRERVASKMNNQMIVGRSNVSSEKLHRLFSEGSRMYEHVSYFRRTIGSKVEVWKRTITTEYQALDITFRGVTFGHSQPIEKMLVAIKGTMVVPRALEVAERSSELRITGQNLYTVQPGAYSVWYVEEVFTRGTFFNALPKEFDSTWNRIMDIGSGGKSGIFDGVFVPDIWEVEEEFVEELTLEILPGIALESGNHKRDAWKKTANPLRLNGVDIGYYTQRRQSGPGYRNVSGGTLLREEALDGLMGEYFSRAAYNWVVEDVIEAMGQPIKPGFSDWIGYRIEYVDTQYAAGGIITNFMTELLLR